MRQKKAVKARREKGSDGFGDDWAVMQGTDERDAASVEDEAADCCCCSAVERCHELEASPGDGKRQRRRGQPVPGAGGESPGVDFPENEQNIDSLDKTKEQTVLLKVVKC